MYYLLLNTQTHKYAYTYTHMHAHKTKTYLFVIIHNIIYYVHMRFCQVYSLLKVYETIKKLLDVSKYIQWWSSITRTHIIFIRTTLKLFKSFIVMIKKKFFLHNV